MIRIFKEWLSNTSGATAIEYGVIVASVAIGASAVIFILGDNVVALFNAVADSFE